MLKIIQAILDAMAMVSVMWIEEVEHDVVLRKEDFESLIGETESLTEAIDFKRQGSDGTDKRK